MVVQNGMPRPETGFRLFGRTRSKPFSILFSEALSCFRPVSEIQPRKQKQSIQNGIRYQDGMGFSRPAFTPNLDIAVRDKKNLPGT
jgi:hypothetical protein